MPDDPTKESAAPDSGAAKPSLPQPPPAQPVLTRAGKPERVSGLRRGMIFWAEIGGARAPETEALGSEQLKMRPWLVVSRDQVHRIPIAVVVPLSTQLHKAASADFRGYRIRIPEADIQRFTLAPGVPSIQA